MPAQRGTPANAWVLYDGLCGFCSRWVPRWTGVLERRGFYIDTLQEAWVAEQVKLPTDELVSDLRLLLANGEHLQGAAVYRYVMRRIWWAWPIYFASTLPVLRNVFDGTYRRFADNRYWISRTCHMPRKPRVAPDR
jgi:predicted DCC family thiol-disulfide oxidoreductase YuxK